MTTMDDGRQAAGPALLADRHGPRGRRHRGTGEAEGEGRAHGDEGGIGGYAAAAFAVRESDPEMAAYARAYADRAGERAEQRELVAASRKAAAEAAAVAVKNAGKAKTRGKRRRA